MSAILQCTAAPAATLERLQTLVAEEMSAVNRAILAQIERNPVPLIHDLSTHIIASGGKRLRPALTLACAALCGYRGTRHIPLAACVEFIHTATLLHDDVVDESKLRRGLATANDIWGNKSSVLVGDYILSLAFQMMVADGSIPVLKVLSDASATIAQGEVKQLMSMEDMETSEARYFEIIHAKTAVLFEAACRIGALVSERAEQETALQQFGSQLGIAFQLVDDALDYAASEAEMGKTVGDDWRDGEITLPLILAYAGGTPEERRFLQEQMAGEEERAAALPEIIQLLHRHRAIERTMARAQEYCDAACKNLMGFPNSEAKQALIETVGFCRKRTY